MLLKLPATLLTLTFLTKTSLTESFRMPPTTRRISSGAKLLASSAPHSNLPPRGDVGDGQARIGDRRSGHFVAQRQRRLRSRKVNHSPFTVESMGDRDEAVALPSPIRQTLDDHGPSVDRSAPVELKNNGALDESDTDSSSDVTIVSKVTVSETTEESLHTFEPEGTDSSEGDTPKIGGPGVAEERQKQSSLTTAGGGRTTIPKTSEASQWSAIIVKSSSNSRGSGTIGSAEDKNTTPSLKHSASNGSSGTANSIVQISWITRQDEKGMNSTDTPRLDVNKYLDIALTDRSANASYGSKSTTQSVSTLSTSNQTGLTNETISDSSPGTISTTLISGNETEEEAQTERKQNSMTTTEMGNSTGLNTRDGLDTSAIASSVTVNATVLEPAPPPSTLAGETTEINTDSDIVPFMTTIGNLSKSAGETLDTETPSTSRNSMLAQSKEEKYEERYAPNASHHHGLGEEGPEDYVAMGDYADAEVNVSHLVPPVSTGGPATSAASTKTARNRCSEPPTSESSTCLPIQIAIIAWVWNSDQRRCQRIIFKGCGRTANYFRNSKECLHTCHQSALTPGKNKGDDKSDEGGGDQGADVCSGLSVDSTDIACSTEQDVVFEEKYIFHLNQCKPLMYAECRNVEDGAERRQSNGARVFDTLLECRKACLPAEDVDAPSSVEVCRQRPKVTGQCQNFTRRWSFMGATKGCEDFVWGGCDGSLNRFESKSSCQKKCLTLTR